MLRKHPSKDYYTTLARKLGLLSRAAFKLQYIQKRYGFLKPGDKVIILGSAPGGMAQLAARYVGPRGLVVAVDVKPQDFKIADNVVSIIADVFDPEAMGKIREALKGELADKLISDLAPNLTGIREVDMPRQLGLVEAALRIAKELVRKGGSLYIKLFESPEVKSIEDRLRLSFQRVKRIVPTATRKHSSEVFLLALDKK
ncbi:MAG: RlmE family RNA methyltransferase [Nitrososphaerota archaeon]